MSVHTAPVGVRRDPSTRSRAWLPAAAATFAIAWGGNEFTPLLQMYRQSDGFSAVTVDTLLFAYVLGIVPALLVGGPLSDRLGRRPLMLPAPLLAAAGSLVLALGDGSVQVLMAGRVLGGIALGIAMAVGGSWIEELSSPPWGDGGGAGVRRAAMSLTGGFGVGAAVAGVLAQWGPMPTALPYALDVVLSLATGIALLRAPESRAARVGDRPLLVDLKIPAAAHRRFLFVVVPLAPWVFGAAASAYAVMPALMADHAGGAPIAFSALLCTVALSCGFAVQSVGRRSGSPTGARAVIVALSLLVVGMVVSAWAAASLTLWLSVVAAAVLGCGYGRALVSGLGEVQRIAAPEDLAGLTAVFYGLSYLGFAVPAVLAMLSRAWPHLFTYSVMFTAGAVAAIVCLMIVVAGHRHRAQSRFRGGTCRAALTQGGVTARSFAGEEPALTATAPSA